MYCDYCGTTASNLNQAKYCYKCGKPYGSAQKATNDSPWPSVDETATNSQTPPTDTNPGSSYRSDNYYTGYQGYGSYYRPQPQYAPRPTQQRRDDWGHPAFIVLKVFLAILLISLFFKAIPFLLFFGFIFLMINLFSRGGGWGGGRQYWGRGRWR